MKKKTKTKTKTKAKNLGGRPPGKHPASILLELVLELIGKPKGRSKVKKLIRKAIEDGNIIFFGQVLRLIDGVPAPEEAEDVFDELSKAELQAIIDASCSDAIEDEEDEPASGKCFPEAEPASRKSFREAEPLPVERPKAVTTGFGGSAELNQPASAERRNPVDREPDPTPQKSTQPVYTDADGLSDAESDDDDGRFWDDDRGWEVVGGPRRRLGGPKTGGAFPGVPLS